MNTDRRMSGRSSRSAVGPRNRTSPFSMNTARSASEGHVHRLLDHHDRGAAGVDLAHLVEQLVDDRRGQAERQLVDQSSFGPGHEGHGQRQLLLLAARQVAGQLVVALAEDREQVDDLVAHLPAAPRRGRGGAASTASRRFSATVRVGNTPLPPGISDSPSRAISSAGRPVMSRPSKMTRPLAGRAAARRWT